MISVLSIWFKSLSFKNKAVLTSVLGVLLIILFLCAKLARSEYLRLVQISREYENYKSDVDRLGKKEIRVISGIKKRSTDLIDVNNDINEKQVSDEKIIDSDIITDDEINSFISKHSRR